MLLRIYGGALIKADSYLKTFTPSYFVNDLLEVAIGRVGFGSDSGQAATSGQLSLLEEIESGRVRSIYMCFFRSLIDFD
jgi:hypothetical protein